QLGHGHRAALQAMEQGLALQQLQHQVGPSVVLADLMQGADVGMVERADGLRFALEALARQRAGGLGKELDGHVAVQPRVARLEHLAHAARAQRFEQLEGTDVSRGGHGQWLWPRPVATTTSLLGERRLTASKPSWDRS